MRFLLITALYLVFCPKVLSQQKIDKILKKYNSESIPYIDVDALHGMNHIVLLDAREREEFEVSHLENAVWVGAKSFELNTVVPKIENKDTEIVVYCSIGVRSENIGQKLMNAGYINVKNLYGGIFEWKNKGYSVYDSTGVETERVHAFSKYWGKLLKKGEKVYGGPSQ